jgi:protein-S-isoprenylcysteine O-methyltransferase Ste14
MNQRILQHRPPRIAMFFLLLAMALHWLTPLGSQRVFPSSILAVTIGLSGFLVMMWAWWQFKQQEVAICPTETTVRLITDGIYRYTRNPMYLGVTMMLLAVALEVGTIPFFVAATGFFLVIQLVFCPYEEAKLQRTFGAEYRRYVGRVRRWL